MTIHHAIIKAIRAAGSSIEEVAGKPHAFVLTNDTMMLRATGNDARELRQLAQDWARGENIEDCGAESAITEEFEEEETRSGSKVKESYKSVYKMTHGGCGDWMHQVLNELTKNPAGDFDVHAFTRILELNGITNWERYANNGMLRMSGGVRLRTIVKRNGKLLTPDGEISPE